MDVFCFYIFIVFPIQKVVGNDHVLAIVKLKEEEMEKNDQADTSADADDEDDQDVEHAPKINITRSKAKVLNKKILPITAPSEPSEASILIQAELGSDDEDEEYEPGNDDAHVRVHPFGFCLLCWWNDKIVTYFSRTMTTTHRYRTWTHSPEHRRLRTRRKKIRPRNTPTTDCLKFPEIEMTVHRRWTTKII